MGLGDECKTVSTPGVRTTDEDDGKELDAQSRAFYRSWRMLASHLSQDRYELHAICSDGTRETDAAAEYQEHANAQALGAILERKFEVLVVCGRQAEQQVVDVFSDSDWAGCTKTRRSTSSSYVGDISLLRQQQLKLWWRHAQVKLNCTR